MNILAELSGIGHYGVCIGLQRESIPKIMNNMENIRPSVLSKFGQWVKKDFYIDPWRRTGIDESLFCVDKVDDQSNQIVRLGLIRHKLESALTSIILLGLCLDFSEEHEGRKEILTQPSLEISVGESSHGWVVRANFGEPIWSIIESDDFSDKILPILKEKLALYWEDLHGGSSYKTRMENTFVHPGVGGKYIQIYHPVGNGLWITGSRKSQHCEYQLTDHNTDSAEQAFGHIYALCVVLDECRKLL